MSSTLNRRDVLRYGLGAAGLVAGGGWPGLLAADAPRPNPGPDRSLQAPSAPVAIERCESYEPQVVRRALDESLRLLGGIGKLVAGKTVTIKLNLTGGPGKLAGLPAHLTYHVHPAMVAAVCAAVHDAGARRIVLVESQYSAKSPEEVLSGAGWDVAAIKSAAGQQITLEDTRNRGRWPAYSRLKVAWGGFVFPAFDVNQCYEKTDVFISLAKLKDHATAGVTMSVKNLFGIMPTSLYGSNPPNEQSLSARMGLHDGKTRVPAGVPAELDHGLPADPFYRVPRITADTLGARPIDLAVIDGVQTNRGGEGPWVKGVQPLQPKLILAGFNPVCTDAVCTAVMGYDPQADHRTFPFPGENHLRLLASVGMGTIDPQRIEVRGLSIQKALFLFNPKRIPFGQIGRANGSPGCLMASRYPEPPSTAPS